MKARTRSDSPESNHSGRKEGNTVLSESSEIAKKVGKRDNVETVRTDDAVFEEPQISEITESRTQQSPVPIEVHYRESLT